MNRVYDVLIIGGGPAGLSAGLCLGRVKRTAVVFDSHVYRNQGIEHVHSVLSRDGEHPQRFRDIGKQQIVEKYHSIEFVDTEIVRAGRAEVELGYDGFEVTDNKGEVWMGKKLILATGSRDIFPDIEGFADCWPCWIYQCFFCDGFERASSGENRPVGILPIDGEFFIASHFALQAFSFTSNVTILANGPTKNLKDFHELFKAAGALGCKVDERPIVRMSPLPGDEGLRIEFETGEDSIMAFLGAKPRTEQRSQSIIDQLGVNVEPAEKGGEIIVKEPFNESSVKGCFVAGDARTPIKNVTGALHSGACVAAGTHIQLAHEAGQRALAKTNE